MRRLASLGWVFLWVSSMTLGGGMAMLPLLERELVARRRWLTSDELVETIAVVQSLPGLIAINMAVLILLSLARLARAALDGPFAWTVAALAFLAAVVLQVDLTFVVLIGFAAGLALAVARALGRARRS